MRNLSHAVARPLMRWWVASVNRSIDSVPRPTDAPQVHAAGRDSDRVLIFGAGAAVGWGVATHNLALPGALARALSASTGRGADVDVIVDRGMSVAQSVSVLRTLNLMRYDAIIVVLGVNDALRLTPLSKWRKELSRLLAVASELSLHDTKIVVTGIQPIRSIPTFDRSLGTLAGRHALALNRETAALCASSAEKHSAQAHFVPLALPRRSRTDDRHRAPSEYARWGKLLAASLSPLLSTQHHARGSRRNDGIVAVTEVCRQRAVDALVLRDDWSRSRLTDILTVAQRAFRAESATITLLDRDRLRYLAQVGTESYEISRTGSLCDAAIRGTGAMIVRDAHADGRFSTTVAERFGVRFYAGFPIELHAGERIGTLCVVDSRPRQPDEHIDEVLLREFALMAQRELLRNSGVAAPVLSG